MSIVASFDSIPYRLEYKMVNRNGLLRHLIIYYQRRDPSLLYPQGAGFSSFPYMSQFPTKIIMEHLTGGRIRVMSLSALSSVEFSDCYLGT